MSIYKPSKSAVSGPKGRFVRQSSERLQRPRFSDEVRFAIVFDRIAYSNPGIFIKKEIIRPLTVVLYKLLGSL